MYILYILAFLFFTIFMVNPSNSTTPLNGLFWPDPTDRCRIKEDWLHLYILMFAVKRFGATNTLNILWCEWNSERSVPKCALWRKREDVTFNSESLSRGNHRHLRYSSYYVEETRTRMWESDYVHVKAQPRYIAIPYRFALPMRCTAARWLFPARSVTKEIPSQYFMWAPSY